MDHQSRNRLLSKVLSGIVDVVIDGCRYVIKHPTQRLLYRAEELYNQTLEEEKWREDWLPLNYARHLSQKNSKIGGNIEENLKSLEKIKDETKLAMYENYLNKDSLRKLRAKLKLLKEKITETYAAKHSFDHVTSVGYASAVKSQFLLIETTFKIMENRKLTRAFSSSLNSIPYPLLDALMGHYNESSISSEILRELARTEPWRLYWSSTKGNIFGKPPIKWTDNQLMLVNYSKMYDSIHRHEECPPDEIINDDDLLDGWLLYINKKTEGEKNRKSVDNLLSEKHRGGSDVFLMASSQEDAQKIYDMNTQEAKRIKAQRAATVRAQGGKANEMDLPDVKMDLLLKANSIKK